MTLRLKDGITLYFARHGQTQANVEKRFAGKRDTPLTALGLMQAKQVGAVLLRELGAKPALVFVCSPLHRACQTMEIVREELALPREGYATDPRLEEIDLGIWDQLTDDEARALDPDFFSKRGNDKWNVRVPQGENYADVAARLESFIGDLSADTLAISHGATIRILRGLFAGLTAKQMSDLDEPQGVVFRVRGSDVEKLAAV